MNDNSDLKDVISVSRRTDVPGFYGDWFMNRIREGVVKWRHPFGGELRTASLRPGDVAAFVFWTKYPDPFTPHIEALYNIGHRFYFQFTITSVAGESFGRDHFPFEPNVPSKDECIESFIGLSRKCMELYGGSSPDHVQWRFDPIVMSSVTDAEFHIERFDEMCSRLAGYTRRCYFSFPVFYGKVRRAVKELVKSEGIEMFDISRNEKRDIANRLADIAAGYGITMYSCCGDFMVNERIRKASCVDADILSRVTDRPFSTELRPTRPGCGCINSMDIGSYYTCVHGCVYCYANADKKSAQRNYDHHDSIIS